MNPQTILIVDDEEEKRITLTDYILSLGHRVLEAENGLLGLAEARRCRPDLILLDLTMQVMNGMQFLDAKRVEPAIRDVPVIIITKRDSSEYSVAECIRNGADDILTMPLEYEILKARLENCLARRIQQRREAELREQLESLLLERQEAVRKADRLLKSIFPTEAIRELQSTDTIVPRRFEDVAVMFCDIVNFTGYCEAHPPDVIVRQLELLVERQEAVADSYQVEKVKTIGDSFMAVAGLHRRHPEYLLNCIRCGLEFTRLPRQLSLEWEVRVGIHLGPVVAGKIGSQKFSYDLWGDTVNTAQRIEHEAGAGTVTVSASVWGRVADRCAGQSMGVIPLRGRQPIELYQVGRVL